MRVGGIRTAEGGIGLLQSMVDSTRLVPRLCGTAEELNRVESMQETDQQWSGLTDHPPSPPLPPDKGDQSGGQFPVHGDQFM